MTTVGCILPSVSGHLNLLQWDQDPSLTAFLVPHLHHHVPHLLLMHAATNGASNCCTTLPPVAGVKRGVVQLNAVQMCEQLEWICTDMSLNMLDCRQWGAGSWRESK